MRQTIPSLLAGALLALCPLFSAAQSVMRVYGQNCTNTDNVFTFGGNGCSVQSWSVNGSGYTVVNQTTGSSGSIVVRWATAQSFASVTAHYECYGSYNSVTSQPVGISASVTPSVTISPPTSSVQQGQAVSFTASPQNGGGSPQYTWRLNGAVVGTNSAAYTASGLPAGTHTVTVSMASNAACASPVSATGTATVTVASPVPNPYSNLNYVATTTVLEAGKTQLSQLSGLSHAQAAREVSYVDGLGRPLQSVAVRASPSATDVVSHFVYDALGREEYSLLPYTGGTNGHYKADAVGGLPGTAGYTNTSTSKQYAFYQLDEGGVRAKDTRPYSRTEYEPSPLNRVVARTGPGDAWHTGNGKKQLFWYGTNTANAVPEYVRIPQDLVAGQAVYRASAAILVDPAYTSPQALELSLAPYSELAAHKWKIVGGYAAVDGLYAPGELSVTRVTDEDGGQALEFKDKEGRTVLKKVATGDAANAHSGHLWTYYVYDDFGNLRFVVPPKAVQGLMGNQWQWDAGLKGLVFEYGYDDRNRLVTKKVPGTGGKANNGAVNDGTAYMVYDKLDRLVLVQDGNQRGTQWSYTRYDALNRPTETGLFNSTASRATLQAQLDSNKDHLNTVSSSLVPLTRTFYDSYNIEGTPPYTYSKADNAKVGYPGAFDASTRVRGKPTATFVRAGTGAGDPWTKTISFYDEYGRVVQVQTVRTGGTGTVGGGDTLTTGYDFAGRVTATYLRHNNPSAAGSTLTTVRDTFGYDHAGRVTQVRQAVNGGTEAVLSSHAYNELGEPVRKSQGGALGAGLQDVDYFYNIRGWVTGINKVSDDLSAPSAKDLFAMNVGYNTDNNGAAPQFNGNIASIRWKTKTDGLERRYDYTYDGVNRLRKGDYVAPPALPNEAFDEEMTYDANGNILTLKRQGLTANPGAAPASKAYGNVDDLSYNYELGGASNRLAYVGDAVTGGTAIPDDFVDVPNTGSPDYTYDANGNLKSDLNKGISLIVYNHLNLPDSIAVTGKGSIKYHYDALGAKTRKVVRETGKPAVTTDYVGGFVYENNVLQFMHTQEGRALRETVNGKVQATGGFKHEYHLKDHLGNLRVAHGGWGEKYRATMEAPAAAEEEAAFGNVAATRLTGMARGGTASSRLNASASYNRPIGPYKIVQVRKGDRLSAGAWGHYPSTGTNYSVTAGNTYVSGAEVSSGTGTGYVIGPTGTPQSNRPTAYLRAVFFNSADTYLSTSQANIPAGAGVWQQLALAPVTVAADGYVAVYVANESPMDVFFDDVEITVERLILQENHYYPFGLNMAGIEREGRPDHLYQYNGKEKQEELGLAWTDYGARMYDAQLGRWHVVDLLAEKYHDISPYSYVANTPIVAYDPDGMRIVLIGSDEYKKAIWQHLLNLAFKSETGADLLMNTIKSDKTFVIADIKSDASSIDNMNSKGYEVLAFDLENANGFYDNDGKNGTRLVKTPETILAHEMSHFLSPVEGRLLDEEGRQSYMHADEAHAVEQENKVRSEMGLPLRESYSGRRVFGKHAVESEYKGWYELKEKKNYASVDKGGQLRHDFSIFRSNRMKVEDKRREVYHYRGSYLDKHLKKPIPSTQRVIYEKKKQ